MNVKHSQNISWHQENSGRSEPSLLEVGSDGLSTKKDDFLTQFVTSQAATVVHCPQLGTSFNAGSNTSTVGVMVAQRMSTSLVKKSPTPFLDIAALDDLFEVYKGGSPIVNISY